MKIPTEINFVYKLLFSDEAAIRLVELSTARGFQRQSLWSQTHSQNESPQKREILSVWYGEGGEKRDSVSRRGEHDRPSFVMCAAKQISETSQCDVSDGASLHFSFCSDIVCCVENSPLNCFQGLLCLVRLERGSGRVRSPSEHSRSEGKMSPFLTSCSVPNEKGFRPLRRATRGSAPWTSPPLKRWTKLFHKSLVK